MAHQRSTTLFIISFPPAACRKAAKILKSNIYRLSTPVLKVSIGILSSCNTSAFVSSKSSIKYVSSSDWKRVSGRNH